MFSDDELIEKIRHGDEQSAEELIRRYYSSILRYCKWHCYSLEKAEDLTQETFYRVFKNLSGYKGDMKAIIQIFESIPEDELRNLMER